MIWRQMKRTEKTLFRFDLYLWKNKQNPIWTALERIV